MYIWYVPLPSCLLNIFFITWTLVLLQLMTCVALHPKVSIMFHLIFFPHLLYFFHGSHKLVIFWLEQVNAGFLIPGLMGLYVVFICWCAIRRYDLMNSNYRPRFPWFIYTNALIPNWFQSIHNLGTDMVSLGITTCRASIELCACVYRCIKMGYNWHPKTRKC